MKRLFPESEIDAAETRRPDHPVDPQFIGRWSPRALVREELPEGIVASLFEAARWSPSSRNEQPWLFVWALPDDPERDDLESLLVEGNAWARNAAVLCYLFAKRRFERNDRENRTAVFDCGAAWMSLSLEARRLGLYTHAMAGIHRERTYEILAVPEDELEVICGIAIGRYGDVEKVAEGKRVTPSGRKPVESFAFRGRYRP